MREPTEAMEHDKPCCVCDADELAAKAASHDQRGASAYFSVRGVRWIEGAHVVRPCMYVTPWLLVYV